jgi:MraZ protein
VLTVNNTRERCLWLYPYDEWEQVERKVVDLPSFDASAQALKRFLIGYATDCELDSAGRVRVSAPLREFAGLEKRVVMIGQGNKFEIWDESCWNMRCDEWLVKESEPGPLPVELETLSL